MEATLSVAERLFAWCGRSLPTPKPCWLEDAASDDDVDVEISPSFRRRGGAMWSVVEMRHAEARIAEARAQEALARARIAEAQAAEARYLIAALAGRR
jgi:hypothetical protein